MNTVSLSCGRRVSSRGRDCCALVLAAPPTLRGNTFRTFSNQYCNPPTSHRTPQSVPQLLRSADLAAERGVPGASREFTAQLFAYTWEPLVAALKKEPDADIQAA